FLVAAAGVGDAPAVETVSSFEFPVSRIHPAGDQIAVDFRKIAERACHPPGWLCRGAIEKRGRLPGPVRERSAPTAHCSSELKLQSQLHHAVAAGELFLVEEQRRGDVGVRRTQRIV